MKIDTLREFLVLTEELNYSKTAQQFYINQSALSRHIMELENELECKLFLRSKQGVRLTPLGKHLAEHARNLIAKHDEIVADMKELHKEANSSIRIGYLLGACSKFFVNACKLYRREHPETTLFARSMQPDKIVEELKSDQIDLGITIWPKDKETSIFEVRRLYDDEFALMVNRRHKLASRKSVPSSLINTPIRIPKDFPHEPSLNAMIKSRLSAAGLKYVETSSIDDVDSTPLMLENNTQVGLSCKHLSDRFAESFRFVSISDIDLSYSVAVLWKQSQQRQSIENYINCLEYAFETHAPN